MTDNELCKSYLRYLITKERESAEEYRIYHYTPDDIMLALEELGYYLVEEADSGFSYDDEYCFFLHDKQDAKIGYLIIDIYNFKLFLTLY